MKTLDIILWLYVVALTFNVINRIEISNRFTALENLDSEVDINSAWETNIRISTKQNLGYYELKKCFHGLMKIVQNCYIKGNKPNKCGWFEQYNMWSQQTISGIKRGYIWKTRAMSLQWTVRTRTSEIYIEE
jgi:hypothetical protein